MFVFTTPRMYSGIQLCISNAATFCRCALTSVLWSWRESRSWSYSVAAESLSWKILLSGVVPAGTHLNPCWELQVTAQTRETLRACAFVWTSRIARLLWVELNCPFFRFIFVNVFRAYVSFRLQKRKEKWVIYSLRVILKMHSIIIADIARAK